MRRQKGLKTISLYAKSSGEYYLLTSYKWGNIYFRKKSFEFSSLEEAELVFRKLTKKIKPQPFSEQSGQKQFAGF
jgi:hypothetical protein